MTKTAAHKSTPLGPLGEDKSETEQLSPSSEFLVAALSMSWQLAVVVLVPVVGGFKLDQHLSSAPLWTIVGFVLAMAGMGAVVWRQLQQLNNVHEGRK